MISDEYIAGFFDADGAIYLSKHGKNQRFRRPVVTFTNADVSIIKDIHSSLGGTISIKNRNKGDNINLAYELVLSGTGLKTVIERLYRHSRHLKKKERLRILIEEYYPITRVSNGGVTYTPEVVQEKLNIEARFNAIIMRGNGAYVKEDMR